MCRSYVKLSDDSLFANVVGFSLWWFSIAKAEERQIRSSKTLKHNKTLSFYNHHQFLFQVTVSHYQSFAPIPMKPTNPINTHWHWMILLQNFIYDPSRIPFISSMIGFLWVCLPHETYLLVQPELGSGYSKFFHFFDFNRISTNQLRISFLCSASTIGNNDWM